MKIVKMSDLFQKQEITYDEFVSVINGLPETDEIIFEYNMNPDLFQMLKYIRRKNISSNVIVSDLSTETAELLSALTDKITVLKNNPNTEKLLSERYEMKLLEKNDYESIYSKGGV